MATFYGSVSQNTSKYAFYIEASEIQTDVANNRSLVRASVKLQYKSWGWQTGNSYSGSLSVAGDSGGFSYVSSQPYGSDATVTLSTREVWVSHNADGSGSAYISASFSPSGTYSPGYCSASGTLTLTTLPRASSISTPNFTVGDNVTVSISRASSSFTHSIQLDVGGVAIKTASGVGASHTWSFTEADIKKIYAAMGSATSGAVVLWCNTYSGSTLVGDAKGTATCYQVGNSTLQTAPTFVVGDSRAYSINRLRAAVTHTLQLYAGSTLIRTATGVGASYTVNLTAAEIAKVYALGTSVAMKMVCTAYHYGRNIGTSQLTGTASAPPVSSITTVPNHTIGSGYSVSITRSRAAVTHTLRLYVAGQQIREATGVGTSYAWTPTATEIAAEYAATPNSNSAAAQATIWCYHYGKLIGTATASGTATVDPAAAAPVFSGFSFADTRPETVALTGDNQTLVAGESTLKVTIPAAQAASSTTSATIKQYILYCGGATASAAFAASDVSIQLTGASSGSIRVAAVDSRGNQTIVERLASLVAYTPPRVTQMQLRRDNNVDNKTKLAVKGVWWPGNFGAADNALTSAYQYKVTSAEQYTDGGAVSISITGGEWSFEGYLPGDLGAGGFDFQKSFSVILSATDALNTTTASGIIDRGIPTMHMDKGGVGIGKLHELGMLDVEGDAYSAGKRLLRADESMMFRYKRGGDGDSTTMDEAIDEYGFDYNTTGQGYSGAYISFSGLTKKYITQLVAYYTMGDRLSFRTKNGDKNEWNPWRKIYHDADKPTPAEIGASDIEEGSWTPKFVGYTSGTATSSLTRGIYKRSGRVVAISFDIIWASAGDLQGPVCLGGLPIASAGPSGAARSYFVGYKNKISASGALFGTGFGDGTALILRHQDGASFSNLYAPDFSAGTEIAGTIVYIG